MSAYSLILLLALWRAWGRRERQFVLKLKQVETLSQQHTSELEAANATKSAFLAGLSHELLNPLNGIIGLCTSLNLANPDIHSSRKLDQLRRSASHLASLLGDLIDLSKRENRAIGLEIEPFDLHELIDAVVAISAAESEKFAIPVNAAISPSTPRYLQGDPRRIRQVLLNLVGNALKYAGHGQVTLTVWCRPTNLPRSSEVIFAVADEGPGIPPHEQGRLFHRFVRGESSRSANTPGSGLGLTLSKELAEMMGGRIWLESELDRGSCFFFSAAFEHAPDPIPPEQTTPASLFNGHHSRAMIVDDQEYNRIILRDLLESMGFSVREASTANEALTLSAQENFTHVLLDYEMPTARGPDVARAIRGLPGLTSQSMIIATTAHHSRGIRSACREAGMNGCLRKPVTLLQLNELLTGSHQAVTSCTQNAVADSLAPLRKLAEIKQLSLEAELRLFLSELNAEMRQLGQAVEDRSAREFARCAHKLCGRLAFVQEHTLARQLELLEATAIHGNWPEIRLRQNELEQAIDRLRTRMLMPSATVLPG